MRICPVWDEELSRRLDALNERYHSEQDASRLVAAVAQARVR